MCVMGAGEGREGGGGAFGVGESWGWGGGVGREEGSDRGSKTITVKRKENKQNKTKNNIDNNKSFNPNTA